MQWAKKQTGFTIVELLIVVVVIAVLAAITIVAYNGIQNRAKESAAKSAASQSAKKINATAVTNAELFPTDKADMLNVTGIQEVNGVSYQYSVAADLKSYCLTTTSGTLSYYTTNTNATPISGGCPGHGVAGLPPVTNRFLDPTFSGGSGTANQSGVTPSIATYNGSPMARAVTTTTTDASIRLQGASYRWAISPGQAVYASATIYNASGATRAFTFNLRFYDTAGASLGSQIAIVQSSTQSINDNSSFTFTVSGTAPANTASVGVNANRVNGTGSASGDTYYVDNVYLSDTASGYADGDSPNWVWNGTQYASTSTGPRV